MREGAYGTDRQPRLEQITLLNSCYFSLSSEDDVSFIARVIYNAEPWP
jgi:hypothetical protein